MEKIIKQMAMGIMWGCTVFCLFSIAGVKIMGYEWFAYSPGGFAGQVAAAMLIGCGFSVPSIVYENRKLSALLKFVIHMGTGMSVYLATALFMRWIPLKKGAVAAGSIVAAFAVSVLIWFCFYLYYRREAKRMNRKIRELEEGMNR